MTSSEPVTVDPQIRPRIAIYTAIAGAYDALIEPAFLSSECDYICFADNPAAFRSQAWEIRPLSPYKDDPVRTGKQPKLLPHRYLPEHDFSVWVDANLAVVGDLGELARTILRSHDLAFYRHPEGRSCLYDEAEICVRLAKDDEAVIRAQAKAYRAEGFPENAGVVAGMCIFRRHHRLDVVRTMERWWEEVKARSRRDQISFPYVSWKNRQRYHMIDDDVRNSEVTKWEPHKARSQYDQQAARLASTDVALVSFPKSGRTWLRYFLARYLERAFERPLSLDFPRTRSMPALLFTHNYFDDRQDGIGRPTLRHRAALLQKDLIVLVRDPRDVIVSYFHQKHDREKLVGDSLDEFVFSEIYGIERHSRFVLQLLDLYDEHRGRKLLLSYDQMREAPGPVLRRQLLGFLFDKIDEDAVRYALQASNFETMHAFELELTQDERTDEVFHRLGVPDWDGNEQALKTRKGQVGGFEEEMGSRLAQRCAGLPFTLRLLARLRDPDADSGG